MIEKMFDIYVDRLSLYTCTCTILLCTYMHVYTSGNHMPVSRMTPIE